MLFYLIFKTYILRQWKTLTKYLPKRTSFLNNNLVAIETSRIFLLPPTFLDSKLCRFILRKKRGWFFCLFVYLDKTCLQIRACVHGRFCPVSFRRVKQGKNRHTCNFSICFINNGKGKLSFPHSLLYEKWVLSY